MNPLEWRGPEFLQFYLVVSSAVWVAIYLFRQIRESMAGPVAGSRIENPYHIAYLRSGRIGALQVAALSLVNRGILAIDDDRREMGPGTAKLEPDADPLEQALARHFAAGAKTAALFGLRLPQIFGGYAAELERHGLLPDAPLRMQRMLVFAAAAGGLVLLAGTKIALAVSRGRSNIWFLAGLSILAVIVSYLLANPRLTVRGRNELRNLRTLFSGLRGHAESLSAGRDARELALLAAVFGMSAIPLMAMPSRHLLAVPGSADGGSSWHSSSSCGSSDGGGSGCGGGCGGCGS